MCGCVVDCYWLWCGVGYVGIGVGCFYCMVGVCVVVFGGVGGG